MHTSLDSKKAYIGLTSRAIECRWSEHVSSAKTGSQRHFHRALLLYGEDAWDSIILHDDIKTMNEAYELEKYYIKKYNTFENGYNLSEGGEGNSGLKLTEYHISQTWVNNKGLTEICTPYELMVKYDIDRASMYAYISNVCNSTNGWTSKGIEFLPSKKLDSSNKITVYHDTLGKFVGTVQDFSVYIEKPIKHINKMLSGKYKTVDGWRLTEDKKPVKSKEVYGFDKDTLKLVVTYPSSFEASRQLNLPRKETMSEWLSVCPNGKIYGNLLYSYSKQAGDTNIGIR